MLALVNRSAAYLQALCLILLPDYELLRKLLPHGEEYQSCGNSVGRLGGQGRDTYFVDKAEDPPGPSSLIDSVFS